MKWMVELVKVNGCRGNSFDEVIQFSVVHRMG